MADEARDKPKWGSFPFDGKVLVRTVTTYDAEGQVLYWEEIPVDAAPGPQKGNGPEPDSDPPIVV